MLNKHIIPSAVGSAAVLKAHGAKGEKAVEQLVAAARTVEKSLAAIHHADDEEAAAKLARVLRLETMVDIRKTVDGIEALTPAAAWTLPTYHDLLFLDQNNS